MFSVTMVILAHSGQTKLKNLLPLGETEEEIDFTDLNSCVTQ